MGPKTPARLPSLVLGLQPNGEDHGKAKSDKDPVCGCSHPSRAQRRPVRRMGPTAARRVKRDKRERNFANGSDNHRVGGRRTRDAQNAGRTTATREAGRPLAELDPAGAGLVGLSFPQPTLRKSRTTAQSHYWTRDEMSRVFTQCAQLAHLSVDDIARRVDTYFSVMSEHSESASVLRRLEQALLRAAPTPQYDCYGEETWVGPYWSKFADPVDRALLAWRLGLTPELRLPALSVAHRVFERHTVLCPLCNTVSPAGKKSLAGRVDLGFINFTSPRALVFPTEVRPSTIAGAGEVLWHHDRLWECTRIQSFCVECWRTLSNFAWKMLPMRYSGLPPKKIASQVIMPRWDAYALRQHNPHDHWCLLLLAQLSQDPGFKQRLRVNSARFDRLRFDPRT